MKSKHTRGPWVVSGNDVVVNHVDECLVIARVEPQGDETSSNASLIAAAPDMYAAIRRYFSMLDDPMADLTAVREDMAATLKKADGR